MARQRTSEGEYSSYGWHLKAIALSAVVAVGLAVAAPAALADADLSVTQWAFEGRGFETSAPPHTGPIPISPNHEMDPDTSREVSFRVLIENDGPDRAIGTFRWHASGYKGEPGSGYTFWTAPTLLTTEQWSGENVDECTSARRCTVDLKAGETYEVWMSVRGNAPGSFSLYGTVKSETNDPVTTNNTTELFSEPVVCAINGTRGDDVLVGTSSFDSICGKYGDDKITAVGSLDKVFGGGGDDLLMGNVGRDAVRGGPGTDHCLDWELRATGCERATPER